MFHYGAERSTANQPARCRLFQSWATATGKARLPTVDSLTDGTARRLEPAERSGLVDHGDQRHGRTVTQKSL